MATQIAPVPNYPLAERATSFSAARRVVKKTGSYPMERAIAVAGQGAIFAGALILGLGLTVLLFKYVHMVVASLVFIGLCVALVFVLMPQIEKKLWQSRAAFAYLVTELLVRSKPAPDKDASALAQRFLTEQFGDLGPVADAHNKVQRMVGAFFRTFDKLHSMLPIDLGPVRNAMAWVTDRIAPRVADLALSFAIARGDKDFAAASEDAVVYVAQNPQAILGTAIRAYLTERVLGALVGLVTTAVCFAGVFLLVHGAAGTAAGATGIPKEGAQVAGLFAAVFAGLLVGLPIGALVSWFVRTAFIEPVGLTMLLCQFHSSIQGQAVDPALRERIRSASGTMKQARGVMNLLD